MVFKVILEEFGRLYLSRICIWTAGVRWLLADKLQFGRHGAAIKQARCEEVRQSYEAGNVPVER
jgi:hypothetical protein